MFPLRAAIIAAAIVFGSASVSAAQITRDEALAAVYPGATIRAEQIFLSPTQQKRILEQSDEDVPSALVARYVATKEGIVVGRAYADTHTVRTKKESLLVSLDEKGQVKRVDVTALRQPRQRQYAQPVK